MSSLLAIPNIALIFVQHIQLKLCVLFFYRIMPSIIVKMIVKTKFIPHVGAIIKKIKKIIMERPEAAKRGTTPHLLTHQVLYTL